MINDLEFQGTYFWHHFQQYLSAYCTLHLLSSRWKTGWSFLHSLPSGTRSRQGWRSHPIGPSFCEVGSTLNLVHLRQIPNSFSDWWRYLSHLTHGMGQCTARNKFKTHHEAETAYIVSNNMVVIRCIPTGWNTSVCWSGFLKATFFKFHSELRRIWKLKECGSKIAHTLRPFWLWCQISNSLKLAQLGKWVGTSLSEFEVKNGLEVNVYGIFWADLVSL